MLFKRKKLKMIWGIKGKDKTSYLIGTSHIFSHSFRDFLEYHISKTTSVVIEGPLDKEKMEKVVKTGMQNSESSLHDILDEQTIERMITKFINISLEKLITSIREFSEPYLRSYYNTSIKDILKNYRHWMAFFSLWYLFLNLMDWKHSMDLDAFKIAHKLKKKIYYLEEIDEQIKALESIPLIKTVSFIKKIDFWESYIKDYEKIYLKGDLTNLMSHTEEFPTRCESIINKRDSVLYERMYPFLEQGDSIILVGITHVAGILDRAIKDGFHIID